MLCSNCEKLGLRPERFQCTLDTRSTELEPFCHKIEQKIRRNGSCQLCGLIHKSVTAPVEDKMRILGLPPWAQRNRAVLWVFDILLCVLAILRSIYYFQTEFVIEWVTDGTVKWVKNGRKTKPTEDYNPITRRRRIRVSWGLSDQRNGAPKSERETLYLVHVPPRALMDPNTDTDLLSNIETTFLAQDSSKDIYPWIESWIKLCEEEHQNAYTPIEVNDKKGRQEFRDLVRETWFCVVDVQNMCLTDLKLEDGEPEPYVALSYVWGKEPDSRHWTLRSNIMRRKEIHDRKEKLGLNMDELPRTIQDAIRLVKVLGDRFQDLRLRYIWIDSLCVLQDSFTSWKRNAEKMDLIFGNAYFTICAADGDAATGLMALDPKRRNVPRKERVKKGLELLVSNSPESVIQRSRWSTRGWTFQERILSRRCVIFAGGRIYLQCRRSNYDDSSISWSSERRKSPLHTVQDLEDRPIWFYMTCLELYTGRNLTEPADILKAFNGVSRVIEDHLCAPFFFGLPSSHFDFALLWRPTSGKKRREADREKDAEFPSWSWSGWQDSNPEKGSAVYYPADILEGCLNNLHYWLIHHTWIVWYIRDSNGDIEPLWQGYTNQYIERSKDRAVQWSGYGDRWNPAIQHGKNDHSAYGRKPPHFTNNDPPLEQTDFKGTLPNNAFGARISRERKKSYQPILQFWTYKCDFYIVLNKDSRGLGAGLARLDVLDKDRDWCGTVLVDESWAKARDDKEACQFIALSDARKFTDFECTSWTDTIPKNLEDIEWNLYHVMLIEYLEDQCVWERRGLGKILKVMFEVSKWSEIMLS